MKSLRARWTCNLSLIALVVAIYIYIYILDRSLTDAGCTGLPLETALQRLPTACQLPVEPAVYPNTIISSVPSTKFNDCAYSGTSNVPPSAGQVR